MCGFISLHMLNNGVVDRADVERMRDVMKHRGPDDVGLHIEGNVALGHRRLSIVDLSEHGRQPISNEDGSVWIVFNGEIYNYVELALELRERGHRFNTITDTEVIVHLWEELGPGCVEKLNGMFAFTIWDSNRRQLFGARDRMGIKPFFYHLGSDRFIAASEIKAILEDPTVSRAPDYEGISDYMLTGFPMGERTTFQGISQLEPGHAMLLENGKLNTWKYWDLEFNYNYERSAVDTALQLEELLDDAVKIHCRSDAALGCHLSGGLDSSTVTAVASRYREPLDTFSIRFDGGSFFDESSFARSVSKHLGTRHHEGKPSHDDLESLLASLAWHSDLPMPGHTIFAYYGAAKLASESVTVALTGHGGDEVFAGYPAQFQAAFGSTSMFDLSARPVSRQSALRRLQILLRRQGIKGLIDKLGNRIQDTDKSSGLDELWLSTHCGHHPLANPYLTSGFKNRLQGYDSKESYLQPLRSARTDHILDRCLYHDLRSYLPGLLHQEDRASMAVSIESRVPLLDYRLVEFMATVPPDIKVPDRIPKGLLRNLARPLLPEEVVGRKDKGAFGVPSSAWFKGPLRSFVKEIALSKQARERGIFNIKELKQPDAEHGALWAAVSMELWFRIFFDRDSSILDRIGHASRTNSRPVSIAQYTPSPG